MERTFYVATLAKYAIVVACNARAALDAGQRHHGLSTIMTVRIATDEEIGLAKLHTENCLGA